MYEFECRNCDSWYVGRTTQHLSVRIHQHAPHHLLPSTARAQRPTRGGPRKTPGVGQLETEGLSRHVCPPRNYKVVSAPLDQSSSRSKSDYQSAVARHLAQNGQRAMAYDDSLFLVLCVCKGYCLDVTEALFIRSRSPNLCTQKTTVTSLKLFCTHDMSNPSHISH